MAVALMVLAVVEKRRWMADRRWFIEHLYGEGRDYKETRDDVREPLIAFASGSTVAGDERRRRTAE